MFNDKWEEYMNSRPEDEDIPEPKDKKKLKRREKKSCKIIIVTNNKYTIK